MPTYRKRKASAADARELLARSASFMKDANKAMDACLEYSQRFPKGPALRDVHLTVPLILAIATCGDLTRALASGKPAEIWGNTDYKINSREADLVASRVVPPVLKNGIVTMARISSEEKRGKAFEFVKLARKVEAKQLLPLFEEAQQEDESLLVDGKSRAVIEKKTRDEVYDDAELYYAAFQEGDLDGALRGFVYLKSLNPSDSYFRNMIGAILSDQGRTRDAVQEFLYGVHLDPGEPRLTANLMRQLTAVRLHATALEVWAHFRRYGRRGLVPESDQMIELFGKYARMVTAALACAAAGVGPDDITPEAMDLIDELPIPDLPWLTKPEESDSSVTTPLDGKRVFISYRRADSADAAQRIRRKLKLDYPAVSVFLDEAAMVSGEDFTRQIHDEIAKADLSLLLIGPRWHSKEGRARLRETGDVLRREVAFALAKELPIIPVLIEDTKMPGARQLPEALRPIAKLHADRLRRDRFETDWASLKKSMIRLVTTRVLRDRAIEQELEELEELLKKDPEAGGKRMDELFGDAVRRMPKFVRVKSRSGEGVSARTNLYGVWECVGIGARQHFSLQLLIEKRPGNLFTGELKIHDATGRIARTHELRGEWAMLYDEDTKLLLGLHLDAVRDDTTRLTLIVPFHRQVGDTFIGADAQGVQYTSRNVEPRVGGF